MRKKDIKQAGNRRRAERTAVVPNNVFSYHANRSHDEEARGRRDLSSNKMPRSRSRSLIRYSPSIIAGIAILVSLVYMLGIDGRPVIQIPDSERQALLLRDEAVYEQTASRLFTSVLTNRNKLTVNTTSIAHEMRREFPELASVSITLPLVGRRPVITLEIQQPALVLIGQNGMFVVDEYGRAVMPVNELNRKPDQLGLPLVTDESGLGLEAGKAVLPKESIDFITISTYQLKQKGIEVESLLLPTIASEMHIRLKGQKYYLKCNLSGDARKQMGAFIAAKEQLEREGASPAEYIDLRVDERVYYK